MTINSLTSISLEPPILMISLNFNTRTGDALLRSGKFAILILGAKQESIARRFAARGAEHFDGGEFDFTDTGVPVVKDALAQAEHPTQLLRHTNTGTSRLGHHAGVRTPISPVPQEWKNQ